MSESRITPETPDTGPGSSPEAGGGKPVLLLDVDGVLNAFPTRSSRVDYTCHVIDGYRIHLHREVADMVEQLRVHYDIVWFTLWNRKASPLIGPHVGLPNSPYFRTSFEVGAQILLEQGVAEEELALFMYAKTPLLPDLLDVGQRWVWIDDAHSEWDWAYLKKQGFDPGNFRLIRTDETAGLTWIEVHEAIDVARGWSEVGGGGERPSRRLTGSRRGPVRPGAVAGRADAVQ